MQKQIDWYPINFDQGAYDIDAVGNAVYLTGITLDFAIAPTTSGELKINLESDYQKDRNRYLFSRDMKGESELNLLSNNPIEFREGEKLWIEYPNTDRIAISGKLWFLH